jgi:hypothetical protein
MSCAVCGTELPSGEWASCRVEQRCLEHCTDFAGHCALPDEPADYPDEDAAYDSAADDAVAEAAEAGDIENWRAYMRSV